MTVYFISRHQGAVDWVTQEGFSVDQPLEHLNIEVIKEGDKVLGTLPINLIADVNKRGARYFHLSLTLPPEIRGQELSADDMRQYGASLVEYQAAQINNKNREE